MKEIDKLFRSSIESYSEEPPARIWENIDHALDKDETKRLRRKYFWLMRVAFSTILALLSFLAYLNWHSPKRSASVFSATSNNNIPTAGNKGIIRMAPASSRNSFPPRPENDAGYRQSSGAGSGIPVSVSERNHSTSEKIIENSSNKNKTARKVEDSSSQSMGSAKLPGIGNKNGYEAILTGTTQILNSKNLSSAGPCCIDKTAILSNHLIPGLGNGEKRSGKWQSQRKWAISLVFSPDFSADRLMEEYQYNNQDIQDISNRERRELSFTAGVLADYSISRRWVLRFGASTSVSNISITPFVVRAMRDNTGEYKFKLATTYGLGEIPNSFIRNPRSTDSIHLGDLASQQIQYLTLPAAIKYQVPKGKITWYGLMGIDVNLITSAKIEIEVPQPGSNVGVRESITKIEGLRKIFLGARLGAGIDYKLNHNWSLAFEPVIRNSITSINQNTPVRNFPFAVSFTGAVKFRL